MTLPADKKIILNTLSLSIASMPEVELAYLYGSFVKSKTFRDLDVAVYLRSLSLKGDTWRLREKIASALEQALPTKLRKPVDCHILQEMPLVLQHRAISEGKLLLARSEKKRIRYEEWVLNQYLDFQPSMERFNREIMQRWSSPHA